MGRSNGPIPIIPDINHKIWSGVFVGADAPLYWSRCLSARATVVDDVVNGAPKPCLWGSP